MRPYPTQEEVARLLSWLDKIQGHTSESKAAARRVWEQVAELTGGAAPVPAGAASDPDDIDASDRSIDLGWFGPGPPESRLTLWCFVDAEGVTWCGIRRAGTEILTSHGHGAPLPAGLGKLFEEVAAQP